MVRESSFELQISSFLQGATSAGVFRLRRIDEQPKKTEWRKIDQCLKNNSIHSLYHFTDRRNVDSIRSHGLLSLEACRKRGIEVPRPGGNTISQDQDHRNGFGNCIHLSLVKRSKMLGQATADERKLSPVWLEISSRVAIWKRTRFDIGNSARYRPETGSELVDLEKIFADGRPNCPFLGQAEILVCSSIPVEFITFPNEASVR